ncbi:MAG: chromosome partitioning protein [Parvicella sp.]|jgi:chromosome partitioning protein
MTKVISFISRKGGTGKTTNAINLCTSLFEAKNKILLIETDPNYTLISTRKMEIFKYGLKEAKLFPIKASQDELVSDEIQLIKESGNYDYIIVDSAGKTTDNGIKELCLASDLVLVTTSLTQNDLLVAYQTVKDLKPAQKIKPNLKIVVLPNRIHSHTRIKTIKDVLIGLDVDMLDNYVPQKKIFTAPSTYKAEKKYKYISKLIIKKINE